MSYSLERNAHKSEADQLSATLIKEKNDREKANTMVSSFSLFSRSHCLSLPALHWRQPGRGCRGHVPPNILVGGTSTGISPQYYYVLSDIADQYWLPRPFPLNHRRGWGVGRGVPFPHPTLFGGLSPQPWTRVDATAALVWWAGSV